MTSYRVQNERIGYKKMTNEEAIKWFETALDNYEFLPETVEAFKLAIESLKGGAE